MTSRDALDACRYDGSDRGHYESWFQRANHPSRPLAFWIRYTIFSPEGRSADAVGELWAVVFDGERSRITAVKQVHPLSDCEFSDAGLQLRIGHATLDRTALAGEVHQDDRSVRWSLRWGGDQPPVLLLPALLYDAPLPKAKILVGTPQARYDGELFVGGERLEVDGWIGSQNHNWGRKHTDHYAWGQVAGFDDDPDAFLELSTARLKLGPLWTPFMTPLVLRCDGHTYAMNGLARAVRAHGRFAPFSWSFATRAPGVRIEGRMSVSAERVVALRYDDPPGGHKICLNTKLARCDVLLERAGQPPRRLSTEHRAAFEILTDPPGPGMEPVA